MLDELHQDNVRPSHLGAGILLTTAQPPVYTCASEAAQTGLPIIRHPLLEFPDDPKAYDCNGEYLRGEKILVAPVLEQGASSRSLYLPQGSWVDYWTGKIMEGGRQVVVPAPVGEIPILVHAGSILPFINPDTETLAQDLAGSKHRTFTNNLIWLIFPVSIPVQDSFTLYDGTVAEASEKPLQINVRVEHSPTVRHYDVILPATRSPRKVTLAGNALNEINDSNHRTEEAGWRMNPDGHTLHVLFQADNFDLKIER